MRKEKTKTQAAGKRRKKKNRARGGISTKVKSGEEKQCDEQTSEE